MQKILTLYCWLENCSAVIVYLIADFVKCFVVVVFQKECVVHQLLESLKSEQEKN